MPKRLADKARLQSGAEVSKRLLCRCAVGDGKKGEDLRQSIVAASELGSAPGGLQVSLSSRHPAVHLPTLATKDPHRFDSRVSILGRPARNPRPDQNIVTPSLAYPASDPLISRQISSPTPLAQALHHHPGPLARAPTRPRTTAAESKLDFLPCSSRTPPSLCPHPLFLHPTPVAHPNPTPMYLVAPRKSIVSILV